MNYSLILEEAHPLVKETAFLTSKFKSTIKRFRTASFIKGIVGKEENTENLFLAAASQIFLKVLDPVFKVTKEEYCPIYEHILIEDISLTGFNDSSSLSEKWRKFKKSPWYFILCVLLIIFGGIFLFSIFSPYFPFRLFLSSLRKILNTYSDSLKEVSTPEIPTNELKNLISSLINAIKKLETEISKNKDDFFKLVKEKYNELIKKTENTFWDKFKSGIIAVVSTLWKIFRVTLFYFIGLPLLLIAYFLKNVGLYRFLVNLFKNLSPSNFKGIENVIIQLDRFLEYSKEKNISEKLKIYKQIKNYEEKIKGLKEKIFEVSSNEEREKILKNISDVEEKIKELKEKMSEIK